MMKIKNLRDLIEEQKENETRLTTEIEALEWSKTQREDKVGHVNTAPNDGQIGARTDGRMNDGKCTDRRTDK